MILTAHSGSDRTPDNSLSFVEKMLKNDITAIEVDVRLRETTQELYLAHDVPADFSEMVLLEEVFAYLVDYPTVQINCDLKEENLEKQIIALSKKYIHKNQMIFSGSVDLENIPMAWRENVFYNLENILPDVYKNNGKKLIPEEMDDVIAFAKANQIGVINAHYRLAEDSLIETFHQAGLQLSLWTVNDFSLIDDYVEKGIYNVTTRAAISYKNHARKERGVTDGKTGQINVG